MNMLRSFFAFALMLVALSACGLTREDIGLGRTPPDEFAVIDRPPLSMPPDFSLRPPKPGAVRPQEVDLTQRATDTLFPSDSSKPADAAASPSEAEKALLETAGAAKADPDIRQTVDRESSQKVVASPHLVDQLLWWKSDEKPVPTVDAAAEAARIKDAKDKGEPLNQGATPIIEREKSGWLGL